MREILEINPIDKAEGTILGEYRGKAVCMPKDTRLNRHIAIFGASACWLLAEKLLLKKRLNAKEKEGEQRTVIALSGIMFLTAFEMMMINPVVRIAPAKAASIKRSDEDLPVLPTTKISTSATIILAPDEIPRI